MSNKLHKLELALICGVLFALVWGAGTAAAQAELADTLIRLHVVAHSDAPEDQEHKLAVRDAILAQVGTYGEGVETAAGMEDVLRAHLGDLEETGERALRARGCFAEVTASVTDCYFPTKEYPDFALPAGTYTALRLEIGAGKGSNWWCVAFPPLCVGASAQSVEEAAQAGVFTKDQAAFLAGEGDGYVLKFKSMELLGELKRLILQD